MANKRTKCLLVVVPFIDTTLPLIGLPYISSFLKQNGYEVKICDLNIKMKIDCAKYNFNSIEGQVQFFNENIEYFKKWIIEVLSFKPHIIGFAMWSTNLHVIRELSILIKKYYKNVYIVCGGGFVSEFYKLGLIEDLNIDSINCLILGEGEKTFLEIANLIEENKYPTFVESTICVNLKNKKIINKLRSEEENIDIFPFPDYSDYDLDNYGRKQLPMVFSRGCKWKCKFCTVSSHWKKFRTRSAENIFNEILLRIEQFNLNKYGIYLYDCACNQDLKLIEQLCDLLINDPRTYNKVSFSSFVKISTKMSDELLKKMRLAGFKNFIFGLESASSKVLKLMYKPYTGNDAQIVIKKTFEAGINVLITVIIGYPGETESDFDDTIKFIETNFQYISEVHLNLFVINDIVRDRYSDILDMNNKDVYKWNLKDMSNTFEIRQNRFFRLKEVLMSKFKNIKIDGMCFINDKKISNN